MDDLAPIHRAFDSARQSNLSCALATLVSARGASYRSVGARMLIDSNGVLAGSISAGCLESDIVHGAESVIATGEPKLMRFKTGTEEEILFGYGTGCDGTLLVLIERIEHAPHTLLDYLREHHAIGLSIPVATVFRAEPPSVCKAAARYAAAEEGEPLIRTGSTDLDAALCNVLASRDGCRARVVRLEVAGGTVDALIEHIPPPPRLLIFGAAPESQSLCRFAATVGWDVWVIARQLTAGNQFPEATFVHCPSYEHLADSLPLSTNSAAVLATHNFLDDAEILPQLLASQVRTISIVSSRGRARKLLDTVRDAGCTIDHADLARMRAPAGLDLGAETPDQVALSILAELQATWAHRDARPLRDSASPIHASAWRETAK